MIVFLPLEHVSAAFGLKCRVLGFGVSGFDVRGVLMIALLPLESVNEAFGILAH